MYLRELFIRNSGPIRKLHIEPRFDGDDNPVPYVIVGRNGTGKTNLLSIITEALMHGASSTYNDVLRNQGLGHSYFRILGGKTITYGEDGGFSVLRFSHGDDQIFFHENAGEITAAQAIEMMPESLAPGAKWDVKNQSKAFTVQGDSEKYAALARFVSPKDKATDIFPRGIYVYFPASRSEHPFWFNQDSLTDDSFDVSDKYSTSLGKPMFVEHGIDMFTQWLLGVITESRLPVITANYITPEQAEQVEKNQVHIRLNASSYLATQQPLVIANDILKIIVGDTTAHFDWMGRHSPKKVGIFADSRTIGTSLNALSGGQATLLSIFGTILRYADSSTAQRPELALSDVEGIVVIDELDAHMHVDLQLDAIPQLMRLFPRVQFFVSSHSPFFTLGMERTFSTTGVRVVQMPDGEPVTAEAYAEFGHALKAFKATEAFENEIKIELAKNEEAIILVGGETDLPYFQAAAKLLGYSQLIDLFEWVGAPGSSGGGFNTGDSALTSAMNFFRANPEFTSKPIVVLFDCDANKQSESFGHVHVIGIPSIPNRKATRGIENLLPDSVLTSNFYPQKTVKGPYGEEKTIQDFDKSGLCDHLCGRAAHADVFADFKPILEQINTILFPAARTDNGDQPPSPTH